VSRARARAPVAHQARVLIINAARSCSGGRRCGCVPFLPRDRGGRRNPISPDVTRCDATRDVTLHSARATKQKIHFTQRGETSSLGVTRARFSKPRRARAGIFLLPFPILLPLAFPLPLFLFFTFVSLLVSPPAKIALFLYNARIRRSYCNLVRSRFRVIGEEKYFHGCGAPTERQREREGSSPSRSLRCLLPISGWPRARGSLSRSENHARP